MDIRLLRTDGDHHPALKQIEGLWAYPDDSPENDKLDVLATLAEVLRGASVVRAALRPA